MTANYGNVKQNLQWAYDNGWVAHEDWADPVTKHEIWHISNAINQLVNAVTFIMGTAAPTWEDSWLYESMYWLKQEGGAVDMDAIIYAMLTAEPDEVMYFVGLVDAFRQSVWNRPFNQEFFAAIARGFSV